MSMDKLFCSALPYDADSRKRVASTYINIIIMTNLTVVYERGHVVYVRRLSASHVSLNPMLYEYPSLDSCYVSGLAT
jgi:hypothetical protein